MRLKELIKQINEGMAGVMDAKVDPLETINSSSSAPEKGKTVKDVKPGIEVGNVEKEFNKKEMERKKEEILSSKIDVSKITKAASDFSSGAMKDNTSFAKELESLKNAFKMKKSLSDEEKGQFDALNRVDVKNMEMFDKIKQDSVAGVDFLQSVMQVTNNV